MSKNQFLGTKGWTAPEIILSRSNIDEGRPIYDWDKKKSDIWSLGCTIYFIVHGEHPLDKFEPELFSEYQDYTEKLNEKTNQLKQSTLGIDRLIAKMIQGDPNQRPDIGTVCFVMQQCCRELE